MQIEVLKTFLFTKCWRSSIVSLPAILIVILNFLGIPEKPGCSGAVFRVLLKLYLHTIHQFMSSHATMNQ